MVHLKKISVSYQGITFPSGHMERNETFTESVIREVREGTIQYVVCICNRISGICGTHIYIDKIGIEEINSSLETGALWLYID